MYIGNSKQLNAYGEANLELPVSGNTKFYATGMYSYRKGKAAGFYRYPKQQSPIRQVVLHLYPRGFLPGIRFRHSTTGPLLAGIKGKNR